MTSRGPLPLRLTQGTLLLGLALFSIIPLVSMLTTALQPQGTTPAGLTLPSDPHWHNFSDAWDAANFPTLLASSSLIVLGVVPVAVALATLAGYGLSRQRVPGTRVIFAVFAIGLTLPPEAIITPLYYQLETLGILGTRWSLILPLIGLFMPFGVYWMRANFRGIPADLGDAAQVDGASGWQQLRSVHLPLVLPACSTLAILYFLWTWNQFLLAITLVNDPNKRTMAGALGAFQGEHNTDIVLLTAGSLIIIAPSLLVFLILQRHFIRAVLVGALR